MTLVWLGSNGLQQRWQGIGGPGEVDSDIDKIQSPRNGDLYLDISAAELYTYDDKNPSSPWYSLNG